MAPRRIKLKRSTTVGITYNLYQAIRLRVEVIEVENFHSAVFVYQRKPVSPYTQKETDEFLSIASAVDLTLYPVGEPDKTKPNPFFRKTFVELDFAAAAQADAAWLKMIELTNGLINAVAALEELKSTLADEVWCGDPAEAGDSESVSASVSL